MNGELVAKVQAYFSNLPVDVRPIGAVMGFETEDDFINDGPLRIRVVGDLKTELDPLAPPTVKTIGDVPIRLDLLMPRGLIRWEFEDGHTEELVL